MFKFKSHFEETLSINGLDQNHLVETPNWLSIFQLEAMTKLPVGFGIGRFSDSRNMFALHSLSISIEPCGNQNQSITVT